MYDETAILPVIEITDMATPSQRKFVALSTFENILVHGLKKQIMEKRYIKSVIYT